MSGVLTLRSEWEPRVLSILRIVTGLLYLQHGLNKLFNFPLPRPTCHTGKTCSPSCRVWPA
jgi:uncharacterized membrane protein YphA (DoxX/SURF4 family)